MLSWFISCSVERTSISGGCLAPSALFPWESLRQLLTACLSLRNAPVLSWLVGISIPGQTPGDTYRYTKKGSTHGNRWALQDRFVQSYQQRIDQRRLAYLADLAFHICHDRERAHRLSQLFYSIFVGSQHILPPVQGDELEALYREVERISDFLPSPAEGKPTRKET
jgi:hypothetical protein